MMKAYMRNPLFWVFVLSVILTVISAQLIADDWLLKRDPNTQGLREVVEQHTTELEALRTELEAVKLAQTVLTGEAVGFRKDSRKYRESEIIRLVMNASEPIGSEQMIDMMGKQTEWTQERLDAIAAQIETHQARLEEMGFPRFDYVYTP